MARGCWTALLIAAVVVIGLAVVVGPTVYREGRAVAGPVVEMAKTEDKLESLDSEFRFTPPSDTAQLTEERLQEFLAVRRELQPLYVSWRDAVATIEREHGESWLGAKQTLTATRDVMTGQIVALRNAGMSPAEFQWLEDLVYQRWRPAQGDAILRSRQQVIRHITEEDLDFVAGLERRHGSSPALSELRRRLDQRLAATADAGPVSTAGISPATQELLWQYRDEIDELDLAGHELHSILNRSGGAAISIGDHRLEFER